MASEETPLAGLLVCATQISMGAAQHPQQPQGFGITKPRDIQAPSDLIKFPAAAIHQSQISVLRESWENAAENQINLSPRAICIFALQLQL